MTQIAKLNDRALVKIAGKDAFELLNRLVTCDLDSLKPGELTFGALLTPQGKILFDFFILREDDGFLFEIAADARADFIKRMMFYRLRADVSIDPLEDGNNVYASWGDDISNPLAHLDPRQRELGSRIYAAEIDENSNSSEYHAHRISVGVPQSGQDFEFGEVFPHDVLMDQFGDKHVGIDFSKGCFVGQEVVSRMQHRGTARRRVIQISAENELPQSGDIKADGKSIGTLTSAIGKSGLANIRMDRAAKALASDLPVSLDDQPVVLTIPDWTELVWPKQ